MGEGGSSSAAICGGGYDNPTVAGAAEEFSVSTFELKTVTTS